MMPRILSTALALALVVPGSARAAEPSPVPPPTPSEAEPPEQPGRPMAIAGTVLIATSAAGYVAMVVGLSMGNNADASVRSLGSADELERRREVIERGQLGNRLALGAGIASAVLMATGVALVIAGRRRAQQASVAVAPLQRGAAVSLGGRF